MSQKMNSLFFAMVSFFSLQCEQKASIKTTVVDEKNISVDITIPLETGQYLYADYIQISVNHPDVLLSSWKSSVEPVMQYDSQFKENRKVIQNCPILSMSVSKKNDQDLSQVDLRLIFYTNKSKRAVEQIFPLTFQTKQSVEAVEQQVSTESIDAKETNVAQESPLSVDEKKSSWLDSLKHIATKSNVLWVRILIAFFLGLLLSLTPCIYPMIPITIGILQAQGSSSLGRNFSLAMAYTLGVATTFACLGLAAALAGHAFGSFMNNPLVILLIIALLVYSAFSLFGFYEIRMPRFLQGKNSAKGGSFLSAFLFGAASGTVASPCLSPGLLFMLTLVATLKSFWAGFILLFAFAIGLSIPLLIIGTFSGSLNLLPRAGSWMMEIKYFFGIMLLGMCFYFLSSIVGLAWLLGMLAVFLLGSGIFYMYHAKALEGSLWRIISNLLGMIFVALSVFMAIRAVKVAYLPVKVQESTHVWESDYNRALQQAVELHKKLYVFVHAPRCGACQDIEEQLKTARSIQALTHVVAFQADLAKDKNISTQAIVQTFNVLGAPVCLLINPETQQVIKRWDGELDKKQFDEMIMTLEQQ